MDTTNMIPTNSQLALIEAVANTVNLVLSYWPHRSGRTTVRHMIAARIILDDSDSGHKPIKNPYL